MFPLVYEINTRVWLKKLSKYHNHPITLGNIPDEEFTFFSNCGFDLIWLMGVWEPSQYSNAIATSHPGLRSLILEHIPQAQPDDIASSPKTIKSNTVNKSLGGKDELFVFRKKLNSYGIKLMLDFIPNHLALDNTLLPDHPEFFIPVSKNEQSHDLESAFEYTRGQYLAYGKDPNFAPWTDTLQLNYAKPETHRMMTDNLLSISSLCDAVRCGGAMLILKNVFNTTWSSLGGTKKKEFWADAIAEVKHQHPDFLFLAESYWNKEWELQQLGFDFTYDKPFYDHICSSPVNGDELTGHLAEQWDYQKHLCRFLENHDEPRAAEKIGLNNKAAALILLATPGMHLIHQDQMDGFRLKIPVQLITQAPEPCDKDLAELYKKLFILQKNQVFQEGKIELLDVSTAHHSSCFGFHRFTTEKHAFVLANFSASAKAIEFRHPALEQVAAGQLNILSTAAENKKDDFLYTGQIIQLSLAPHEGVVITF